MRHRCRTGDAGTKACKDIKSTFAAACHGMSSNVDQYGESATEIGESFFQVPKPVLKDLNDAGAPNEMGESDTEDPEINERTVSKMPVRKLRKLVMKKMKQVRKLERRKSKDLRKVDAGLVAERDYAEQQNRRWKATQQIATFDRQSTPDKYAGGMHTNRKHLNDNHADDTDSPEML